MKKALLVLLLGAAARPAAALMPLPGPAPDWRPEKEAVYGAFARVEDAFRGNRGYDPSIRKILKQVKDLAYQVEVQEKRGMDHRLMFVRDRGVPEEDAADLSNRLRWLYAVRMHTIYGWLVPQVFNEAFKDLAKGQTTIPGYPMSLSTSDDEYCRDADPVAKELLGALAAAGDHDSVRRPGKDFCDRAVEGKAP